MNKWTRRGIEVMLFLVIALVTFAGTRRVLIVLKVHKAKMQIAQDLARQKPAPFDSPFYIPPKAATPWTFGPPPPDLFDLPYTVTPPEPGTPAWYDSLPPVPPCVDIWDPYTYPQCKRVLSYI